MLHFDQMPKNSKSPDGLKTIKIAEDSVDCVRKASDLTGIKMRRLIEQGIDWRLEEDDIEQARRRAGRLK